MPAGGYWYRLHPTSTKEEGDYEGCGIVRLKLTPVDADMRREMYGQPLLDMPESAEGMPITLQHCFTRKLYGKKRAQEGTTTGMHVIYYRVCTMLHF
jgi:hypothetical protein